MDAIRRDDSDEIAAHFGSLEEWESLGDWSTFVLPEPSREPSYLDHGYDESKNSSSWSTFDYLETAAFRVIARTVAAASFIM